MLVRQLQQLHPFRSLRLPELHTVARHAQLLSLPRARWLLRHNRRLNGAYYLLRGRLNLWSPRRQLVSYEQAASHAFYPGSQAVQTHSPVQVLHIDTAPIAFLWEAVTQGGLQMPVPDDAWLSRFLSSPLLQHLDPQHWQGLLRGGSSRWVAAGSVVVAAGREGDEFFVLKQGRAVVQRGSHTLAFLGPGDFFGEDALVTGEPRNATVTMQAAGELLVLPRHRFLQSLVAQVINAQALAARVAGNARPATALWVAEQPAPAADMLHMPLRTFRERIKTLDFRQAYAVAGGSLPQRALAVLLLAQYGLAASYVEVAADTPGRLRPEQYGLLPRPEVG